MEGIPHVHLTIRYLIVRKGFERLGNFSISTAIVGQAYDFYCEMVSVSNSDSCVICGERGGDLMFLDVCGKCTKLFVQ